MQYVNFFDILIVPLFFLIIVYLAVLIRDKYYPKGHIWRNYFITGLIAKMVGSLAIAFIYITLYDGEGDTFRYFDQGLAINEAFNEGFIPWLKLLFHIPHWYSADFVEYTSQIPYYRYMNNYVTCIFSAVFSIISFNRFLCTSLLFAVLSFTGIWALFRIFSKQFPKNTQHLAIAILYFPSVVIWGSGIFKDTVCLFALTWLIFAVFQIFLLVRPNAKNISIAIACIYLIALVKVYILVAIAPAIALWILTSYVKGTRSFATRIFLLVVLPTLLITLLVLTYNYYEEDLGVYALDEIFKTSESLRTNLMLISNSTEGSGYDLGPINYSNPIKFTAIVFKAVNVTLYRPYIWESGKIIIFISALEALVSLYLTILVFWRVGFWRSWRVIFSTPTLQFLFVFTFIFAFSIGISTYNFGTLSRYKIPCLPFFGIFLVLLYNYRQVKYITKPTQLLTQFEPGAEGEATESREMNAQLT